MVAYAQALQFWAEKADLPSQGLPHLLAGSVLELREAMECYIPFPDKAVFSSVSLPKEPLTTQLEETAPENAQPVYTDSPVEEATDKEEVQMVRPAEGSSTFWTLNEEPTRREQPPKLIP